MSEKVSFAALKPGQAVTIGGKVFARCAGCREIVRMDKPLFGSLHWCSAYPSSD